jgi:hypothetical protein
MFGMDMITNALLGYLDKNPEFKAQLDNARAALVHFVEQSDRNAAFLEALSDRLTGVEQTLARIENVVNGGVALKDDALLFASAGDFYVDGQLKGDFIDGDRF